MATAMPPRDPSRTRQNERFLCGRCANDCVFSCGACDNTRRIWDHATHAEVTLSGVELSVFSRRHHLCRATLADGRYRSRQLLATTIKGGTEDDAEQAHNDSGCRSRIRVRGERQALRKRKRPQLTQHRHQGMRVSLPPQWPRRRANPFSSRWLCRYSRTTIGWRCRGESEIECRAI